MFHHFNRYHCFELGFSTISSTRKKRLSTTCIFILFGFFISITSCQTKDEPAKNKAAWQLALEQAINPMDSQTVQLFTNTYARFSKNDQQDSCQLILEVYGKALNVNGMKSDLYKMNALTFLNNKNKNNKGFENHTIALWLGDIYFAERNADSAIYWYQKGLNSIPNKKMNKINTSALSSLAYLKIMQTELDSAEYLFFQAIKGDEIYKDTLALVADYGNLSRVFRDLHEWNLAYEYLDKAEQLISPSDTAYLLRLQHSKATMKLETRDTISFLRFIDSAQKVFAGYHSPPVATQFFHYQNLFLANIFKNDSIKSLFYFNKYDSLANVMNNPQSKQNVSYYRTLLKVQNKDKTFNQAEMEALAKNFEANGSFLIAANLYHDLAAYLADKKTDFDGILKYETASRNCRMKYYEANQTGQKLELEKKFKTAQQGKLIAEQNIKLEKSKFQITTLLFALLGILLSTLLYFVFKKRQEANREIAKQQQFTQQLFEKTEEERKRIATDLHDSVSHDLLDLKSENKTEFAQLNLKIDAIIEDVRSISRNLHPVLFESLGLKISLENMIERMQAQHHIIIAHDLNYNKELNTNDELQVYRIVQEALTNIVKYAQAPAAKVTIEKQQNGLHIVIKDSGKGFNVKEALASTKAFGLHNIIQRSKTLGGNAVIESSEDGTIINIQIAQ
ncbi:MAG: hypothetical protein RI955_710 [Bacteroidota bacterium]